MKHIPDEILMEALELQEQGRSLEHIFAAFPEAKEELAQYFALALELQGEGRKIAPPSREVFRGTLRRAAAMREISAKPAARLFERVPFGFRVLAPVLAVLLIVFLANDSSKVAAPPVLPTVNDQTGDSAVPETFLRQAAPASQPAAKAPSAAAPMSPLIVAGPEMAAPQSPAEAADQIAALYIANGESDAAVSADFAYLEQYLAGASEAKRKALADFEKALQSAAATRQLAIEVADENFREDTRELQARSASQEEFSRLTAQYEADIRSITDDFEAKVGAAQATFKAALQG